VSRFAECVGLSRQAGGVGSLSLRPAATVWHNPIRKLASKGNARPRGNLSYVDRFVIAKIDTPACTLGLKLHAEVSLLAIKDAHGPLPGAGTPEAPASHHESHPPSSTTTRRELDVVLPLPSHAAVGHRIRGLRLGFE